jgi:hypothetical protein
MWMRRKSKDVVAQSIAETQVVRSMLSESGELLTDIEGELMEILSTGARADIAAVRQLINRIDRRH